VAAASLRKAERSEDKEKRKWEGGERRLGRMGGFLQLKPRRGGGNVGGAGRGLVVFQPSERESGVGGSRKGMVLTGGPHPSATSKREGKREGEAAGPRPRKERARAGGGGCWATRPKRGRGREIPFYFQTNFQCIFQMDF